MNEWIELRTIELCNGEPGGFLLGFCRSGFLRSIVSLACAPCNMYPRMMQPVGTVSSLVTSGTAVVCSCFVGPVLLYTALLSPLGGPAVGVCGASHMCSMCERFSAAGVCD